MTFNLIFPSRRKYFKGSIGIFIFLYFSLSLQSQEAGFDKEELAYSGFIATAQNSLASKNQNLSELIFLQLSDFQDIINENDEVSSQTEFNTDQDDESNIFTYTPSKLLKSGQIEAQLFNNLYTQTAYRDENREKIELDSRDTYYSALFYALYGVSKSSRINIGFDLNLKSVLIDTTKGSPLNVFRFANTSQSRTAVTSLGPKIKFQPFKSISNVSIQSAFWIPIAKDLESIEEMSDYPWMDYHMYTWWNQFFYDKNLGSNWQIFLEADLLFRFKTENGNIPNHMDIPLSVFVSWFPINNITVYYMLQYSPRFQLENSYQSDSSQNMELIAEPFDLISDFAHTGLGLKYQITPNFNIEASSTYFFTSMNAGAGATFNLGLRFIY